MRIRDDGIEAGTALRALVLLVAVAAAASCGGDPGAPPGLDREIRVRHGEQVYLSDSALAIAFADVVSDSRCPVDVECAWPGEATITLRLTRTGTPLAEAQLTVPSADRHRTSYAGYDVALLNLEPHPTVGDDPAPAEYVAVLVVTQR
jgi:hypothetical protein